MQDHSLPEWQLTLGGETYLANAHGRADILISHHGEHIAYNPRGIGFTISAGLDMNRIICHTCHKLIPFDVIDRHSKLVKLMNHGT